MNILIISPLGIWYKKGGGTPTKYKLIKGFIDAGHEIHLLCPLEKDKDSSINNLHIHEFRLPLSNFRSNIKTLNRIHTKISYFLFILLATNKALKVTRKTRPDIIYGFAGSGAVTAYLIAKIRNIPNITRLYGAMMLYSFIHRRFQLLLRFDEVLGFKIPCKYLIITNDGTKGDEVAKSLGVPAERIKFWMNGVDDMYIPNFGVEKFKESIGIPRDKKIVLAVSRLVTWKGVDGLINAIPSVVSQYKDVIFLIVGDGPEREHLENLTNELNVKDYVKFAGAIPHDEVKYYMNSADIFVSLCNPLSNVGNSLLEAMRCGRCIVTLNTGATGEIIKNKETGILLDVNNINKLPDVIIKLLKDEKLREKLGMNARKYASEHFQTWDERIKMEIKLIEDIHRGRP